MFDFSQIVKDFGPYAALLIFFIWRDYKREQKREEHISAMHDKLLEVITKFAVLVARYEAMSEKVADCVNKNTEAINALLDSCNGGCLKNIDVVEPSGIPEPHRRRPSSANLEPNPMTKDTTKINTQAVERKK